MKQFISHKIPLSAFLFAGLMVFALPFFVIGGSYDVLYVDKDASGTQDGSKDHPFEKISQALDQVEDNDGTRIYVAEGEYKENFNIPEDAQVIGAGKDKTIIKADDDDDAVVYMEHGTKLVDVTVKDGKQGIMVKKESRVEINGVVVKDNDKEGIFILEAGTKDDRYEARIIDSEIKDNDKSGVYGGDRQIIIVDSSIHDNDGNGITTTKNTKLWLEDTKIRDNKKSGISSTLDSSKLFIEDCEIKENGREGIEIDAYGKSGYAKIDNTQIKDNGRYGIARVQRTAGIDGVWEDVVFTMNDFHSNDSGSISPLIRLY